MNVVMTRQRRLRGSPGHRQRVPPVPRRRMESMLQLANGRSARWLPRRAPLSSCEPPHRPRVEQRGETARNLDDVARSYLGNRAARPFGVDATTSRIQHSVRAALAQRVMHRRAQECRRGRRLGLCVDALERAPGVFSARFAAMARAIRTTTWSCCGDSPVARQAHPPVLLVAVRTAKTQSRWSSMRACVLTKLRSVARRGRLGYDPCSMYPLGVTACRRARSRDKNRISHRDLH